GPLTALTFVLTIEDPSKFEKSRNVGPYLGLTPGERQSGESNPEQHITKAGDAHLRRLLVQCTHHILGPRGIDSDIRRHGMKRAARVGQAARRKAVTAVARILAAPLHDLWVNEQGYEPLHKGNPGQAPTPPAAQPETLEPHDHHRSPERRPTPQERVTAN